MAGTGVVWPVDAVSGAPSYTGRMLRNTQAPFLAGATAARPLGAISGVRPGTPNVVSASSTTYTVTPFAGIIDLEAAAISGPYAFAFNANVTGAVTAASGSIARKDIVYVQINDNAEGDGTAGTPNIKIDYLAGTVASTAPATPARSFVIAEINVPISGGGSPTVSWVAPFSVAAGAILPAPSFAALPSASSSAGQYANPTDIGVLVRSDGTSWLPAKTELKSSDSLDVGTTNGASVVMITRVFPSLPFASVVDLDFIGVAGNTGGGSGTLSVAFAATAGALAITALPGATAAVGGWVSVTTANVLSLPANTAATVTVATASTQQAAYKGVMRATRRAA